MADGYQVPKFGMDWIKQKFEKYDRQIEALRSTAGILSAVIGKGGVKVKDGGSILIEDGGGIMVGNNGFITTVGGTIRAIHESTNAAMAYFGRLLPPYKSGLLTATEDGDAFFWAAVGEDDARTFYFGGESARTDADVITLNTESLRLYGLGTTGIAPNIAIDVIGGVPILKLVTSSERGKHDVQPLEVDVEEVIAYQGITWLHQSTLDETPAPWAIRRNAGHHAEAMHQFPSLRQFVNYDDDGLPASVQEGRFEVALLEVVKVLWRRLADHETRLSALESSAASN